MKSDHYKDFILHDIPLEAIEHDISLFFDHRLTEIRRDRCLSTEWPGERDLGTLVALSVPLFIFALRRTIIYLYTPRVNRLVSLVKRTSACLRVATS